MNYTPRTPRTRRSTVLVCSRCGREFKGCDQRRCIHCRRIKASGKDTGPPKIEAILKFAPVTPEECPRWMEYADWDVVESAWPALMVEMFHDDAPGTVAVLARCMCIIKERYREEGAPRKRSCPRSATA